MVRTSLPSNPGHLAHMVRAAKRLCFIVGAVVAATALPALATVQINFSSDDDQGMGFPGFRISRSTPSGMSNVLEIGSDAGQTRMLNFLRISSASTGTDVNNFIVTLPSLRIGMRTPGPSGTGIDFYDLTFDDGTTTRTGGFQIFDPANLTTPILTGNLTLTDHTLLTLGATGAIESGLAINVTSVVTSSTRPTLMQFRDEANMGGGADFVASILSAGRSISQQIMAGSTFTGSGAGAVNTPVPEPGTLLLVGLGALSVLRRKRRA